MNPEKPAQPQGLFLPESVRYRHTSSRQQAPLPSIRYSPSAEVQVLSETPIPAKGDPEVGQEFRTRSGTVYRLVKGIGSGGQGAVFETSAPGQVAKLYFPTPLGARTSLTRGVERKLERMVEVGFDRNHPHAAGICWPQELLLDTEGLFRGYVMPQAFGTPLDLHVLEGDLNALGWGRRHLVQLCLTIMEKVRLLHEANILIGDINAHNIVVQNERAVSLVDTDSYQFEGFPCPVWQEHFVAPSLQERKDLHNVLRSDEDEAFAVATLLFMILFTGQKPFAHEGGGTPSENIRLGRFPYPLGNRPNQRPPEGPWKYIWSHLPGYLQRAFFYTFHAEGAQRPYIPAARWVRMLAKYRETIRTGLHTNELYPEYYKGEHPVTCLRCGRQYGRRPRREKEIRRKYGQLADYCPDCRSPDLVSNTFVPIPIAVKTPAPPEIPPELFVRPAPLPPPGAELGEAPLDQPQTPNLLKRLLGFVFRN